MKKIHDDCYVDVENNIATIGFNDDEKSRDAVKDIIFFEFDVKKGDKIDKGDKLLTIEVMKGTLSLNSRVKGEVVDLNNSVENDPEMLKDKVDEWLLKVKVK